MQCIPEAFFVFPLKVSVESSVLIIYSPKKFGCLGRHNSVLHLVYMRWLDGEVQTLFEHWGDSTNIAICISNSSKYYSGISCATKNARLMHPFIFVHLLVVFVVSSFCRVFLHLCDIFATCLYCSLVVSKCH